MSSPQGRWASRTAEQHSPLLHPPLRRALPLAPCFGLCPAQPTSPASLRASCRLRSPCLRLPRIPRPTCPPVCCFLTFLFLPLLVSTKLGEALIYSAHDSSETCRCEGHFPEGDSSESQRSLTADPSKGPAADPSSHRPPSRPQTSVLPSSRPPSTRGTPARRHIICKYYLHMQMAYYKV